MTCEEIMDLLEEVSPVSYAEDWDNVGLLVGDRKKEVHTVFLALDATDDVIDEAISYGADLIITHHPMIFKGIKAVTEDNFIGRRILKLAKNDISYYAMHTNFDVMGMGDAAADELKIKDRIVLQKTYEDDISTEGFGRVGRFRENMRLRECAAYVRDCFHLQKVKVFGHPDKIVQKVAICPGSGGSMIGDAIKAKADVLITGDIDHHEGIDAVAQGLMVIDAGHYGIEKIFMSYMKEYLKREAKELLVYVKQEEEPFYYV